MFDLLIWSIITIAWALLEKWPPMVLMWVCWSQGICFGFFIFLRLLLVKQSSSWGKYRRARPLSGTFVFLIMTLFFYFSYIYALLKLFDKTVFDYDYIRMILIPTGLYFFSQLFFLIYRIVKTEWLIIDESFFERSLFRIAPMHIMTIGSGFLKVVINSEMQGMDALLFLLAIKILADTGAFIYLTKGFGKSRTVI
jgi:hypothetical protein